MVLLSTLFLLNIQIGYRHILFLRACFHIVYGNPTTNKPLYELHLHCCLMLELDCLYNNTSFWLLLSTGEITYYLSTLNKWVRPLITLSFNHPKPTKALDALSISPFWWLMTTWLKLTKEYKHLSFWVQWFMRGSPLICAYD